MADAPVPAWAPWLIVVLFAGGLLMHDLDRQDRIYFDESYYVIFSHQMSNGIWDDVCWANDALAPRPLNWEHPPLARLIMAGVAYVFDPDPEPFTGCRLDDEEALQESHEELRTRGNPWAWRLPSAIIGTATVAFAGLAAGRIFRSWTAATFASALLMLDGLFFTQSRMAMLDIYATGFAIAAAYAATFPTRKGTFWTAALLGLGFACKFTAAFAGVGIWLLHLWTYHRAGALSRPTFDRTLAWFASLPLVALVLSYLPWLVRWSKQMGIGAAIAHWLRLQREILTWGTGFQADHPYQTPAREWFTIAHPTWLYVLRDAGGPGEDAFIYAVGNPVLWWGAAALVLGIAGSFAVRWVQHRPHGHQAQALAAAALISVVTYGFFLWLGRASFLYYMTIVVPLLAIVTGGALALAWQRGSAWGRIGVPAFLLACVAAFLHYWPVLYGVPMTQAELDAIMHTIPWMST